MRAAIAKISPMRLCLSYVTIVMALCFTAWAQPNGPGMVFPKKTKAMLAAYKAAGWVPLLEPDSRFVPGTIFRVVPGQWPQWISSLESCGVPKAVLKPTRNNSGAFQYNGESVYGASAVLSIPGVSPGAAFSNAHSVTIQQSDAGASAIDIIKVGEWIRHNQAAFSPVCRAYLSKPNTYVAQESYRVGNGTYVLRDKKEVALSLQGLLMIAPSASVKKSGESSLTLTVPVYTAVHGALYANDMLELMDPEKGHTRDVLNYGDSEIDSALPDIQEETSIQQRGVAPGSDTQQQRVALVSAAQQQGATLVYATQQRGVAPDTAPAAQPEQGQGHYYALVIGINNYTQYTKLETPRDDAAAVARTLQANYGFAVEQLSDATRDQILGALDHYRASLGENDSLLVYFAGHGFNDTKINRAYWLPVDAAPDTFSRWISGVDITDRAKAIPARHVLIIADSCYSGDLTRDVGSDVDKPTEHDVYLTRMFQRESRQIMSSGGDEPVLDAGCKGEKHSIFACVLLDSLEHPDASRFTGQELFNTVQVRVVGRSSQTPYYKVIADSGHDGGDFIFSRNGSFTPPVPDTVDRSKIEQSNKEREAVQSVLKKYQDAYDLKNINGLREIWPTMTKVQQKSVQATFDRTNAIQVEVVPSVIQIAGDTATVTGHQWIRYNYQGDLGPPLQNVVKMELAKGSKGEWLLTSVLVDKP